MKNVYIGYDLGDGETIVSYQVLNNGRPSDVSTFIMPTRQKNDKPIPTAFCIIDGKKYLGESIISRKMDDNSYFSGNFKKRPTDLFDDLTEEKISELYKVFNQKTDEWPDVELPESLIKLRDDIVCFTDTLFQYKKKTKDGYEHFFMEEMLPHFDESTDPVDSIVFCVGHPTKWGLTSEAESGGLDKRGALDIAIYKKIIQQTCLKTGFFEFAGKKYPSKLLMDAESRAAFLYTRNYYGTKFNSTNINFENDSFLLVDVGSSTIDITAIKQNVEPYNHGNTFLGARIIDYQILHFFENKIRQKNSYNLYEDYVKNNNGKKQVLLCSRYAKENLFSQLIREEDDDEDETYCPRITPSEIALPGADAGNCMSLIELSDLEKLEKEPIQDILRNDLGISEEVLACVKNNTWEEELIRYLSEQNDNLKSKGFSVNKIILTGSASLMPSVRRACEAVFSVSPLYDSKRACSIANGLVFAGVSNEKSEQFQKCMEIFEEKELPDMIENNILSLADRLSDFLAEFITEKIIKDTLLDWKEGNYQTLNDAVEKMKYLSSQEMLSAILNCNSEYRSLVEDWIKNLIKQVTQSLAETGAAYGITITEDDLTGIIIPPVSISSLPDGSLNSLENGMDALNSITTMILGVIVTSCFAPIVISIIALISVSLASITAAALAAIPGAGIAFLAVMAGATVMQIIERGLDEFKEIILSNITKANIPLALRKLIPIGTFTSNLEEQKNQIKSEVYNSFADKETKMKLRDSIKDKLDLKIPFCVNKIRYAIENNALSTEVNNFNSDETLSLRDQIAKRLENM